MPGDDHILCGVGGVDMASFRDFDPLAAEIDSGRFIQLFLAFIEIAYAVLSPAICCGGGRAHQHE